MAGDYGVASDELSDLLARYKMSQQGMMTNAYREAAEARKPSWEKFLGATIPGALMGGLTGGAGGALALGLGGGLTGSGLLGEDARMQTPAMTQMGATLMQSRDNDSVDPSMPTGVSTSDMDRVRRMGLDPYRY